MFYFYPMLFLIIFFTTSGVKENAKLKLALSIHTDAPITQANEAVQTPLVAYKTMKDLSK